MNWLIPISIKGIIFNPNNEVLLLKNERHYWELPGGRIEKNEQPEETLVREIKEELNLVVQVHQLIDAYVYEVINGKYVFIVAYECHYNNQDIILSEEHNEFGWFTIEKLESIQISDEYTTVIKKVKRIEDNSMKSVTSANTAFMRRASPPLVAEKHFGGQIQATTLRT